MTKEEFYDFLENPDQLNDNTVEGLRELTGKFDFFQAGWLLYLKNLKVSENPEYQKLLNKGALRVPERKQLYDFLNKKSVFTQEIFDQPKHDSLEHDLKNKDGHENKDSLIDKFLSSGPSPIRIINKKNDEAEYVPGNKLIENSIHEDDEIITETLAMIYFEQKKYDKALDAFKKLSLKIPEKSIYFAARIAEIEQLKNI
jgi:tetratricopeptide (TPR) repeat protein